MHIQRTIKKIKTFEKHDERFLQAEIFMLATSVACRKEDEKEKKKSLVIKPFHAPSKMKHDLDAAAVISIVLIQHRVSRVICDVDNES